MTFMQPSKGFFPATATNATGISATHAKADAAENGSADIGSVPSSVPKSGRRRESISSQMRRMVTESPALAAGGGGLNFHRSMGQTISPRSKADASALSASLGTAADILSSSGKTLTGSVTSDGVKVERAGHTHFGQECFVPATGSTATSGATPNSQSTRRGSFSSVATDDDLKKDGGHGLHRCEACSKVYRHPSCLIKHRWEHTVYWKEASKFLMSKHQQVQLLEAAAILVGMDTHARSLPEEKALWPAAVSPPESGLLGSDKINFEKLLAQKSSRNKSQSPMIGRKDIEGASTVATAADGSITQSVPSGLGTSLSPLNTFTALNLGRYSRNGDVGSLRLDESAERSVREESLETEDDDDDEDREFDDMGEGDESMTGSTSISTGSPSREAEDRERYGAGAGGDVLADLEMEGVE